jgi:gliding motility-associated-like protein
MKQIYAYLFLFYIISFNAFSQAAPIIQTTIDIPLPACQLGDCTTLNANYPPVKQTNSYTVSEIVYAPPFPFLWDGIASHRVNAVGDDKWSSTVTLPFNFCFYGVNYNQVLIGTNGLITFDLVNFAPLGACPWAYSATIPNAGFPIKNAIYGVYQDTNMQSPSPLADPMLQNVNFYILDSGPNAAPNRVLVVNFNELPQYSCGTGVGLQTSQIVLYESTNIIDVNVLKRTSCTSWNGGRGVIGIQNQAGTNAVVPIGYNTGTWSATNKSFRFLPSGVAVVPSSIVWKKDGVTIPGTANINPISVCPTGPANYTVSMTYSPTCGSPFTVTSATNFVVDLEGPIPVLNPQDITICNSGPPPYTVNINQNTYMLNGGNPADYVFKYYENQTDALNEAANFIPNPNSYLLTTAPPKTLYAMIYNNNTGCYNVRPFQILGASPSGTFSYTSTPYCNTINTLQSETTVGLTSGGSYSATPPGLIIDATTGEIMPYGSTPGSYQVTYSITGACAYTTNTTVQITDCQCTVTASNSGPICEGSTFNLAVTAVPGSTYLWTGPNGFTSTDQNPTNVPAPTGTPPFIYGVTATATVGINICSAQTTVVVNALPTLAGNLSVCQGLQTQLTGTLTPAATNTWVSFNPAVATVNNSGLVTGVSAGVSTITYTTIDGCSASAVVTVYATPSITGTLAVCAGLQTQLTGSLTPAFVNAWVSSDTAIATVDPTGLVTAIASGTTTITYTTVDGCQNTAVIVVNATPVISGTLNVCVGLQTQLTSTQTPASANAWTSSDPSVATVNNSGLVTGVLPGTAILTYTTSNGCTITETVTVNALPTITGTLAVCSGFQTQLTGSASPATVNAWTSSNTAVATVDATGLVTGVSAGTATITYTNSNGCIITANVLVDGSPTISGILNVCVGLQSQLTATSAPAASNAWVSSDPAIATVDANGLVTAIAIGTTVITYTNSNGCLDTENIVVNALPTISGILTVCQGLQTLLTGSASPSVTNAWVSSNTAVAIIGNTGIVTGVSPGNATITYTNSNGCFITAIVSVNALPTLTGTLTVCVGAQTQLTGSATPATVNAWNSSNTAVATVDASGIVTGVTSGTSTITYTNSNSCIITASVTVNPLPALVLTSPTATANQSVCINTPIVNCIYNVSGSATNATVIGLPTGVSGLFSGTTFTISGIPSQLGTFNYTVSTQGGCSPDATLNGVITVNPAATITLTSTAGTANQTVCINESITDITYSVANGATGAAITSGALPAGIVGVYDPLTGIFKISGTPISSGTFNYQVATIGGCPSTPLNGIIIVKPNVTLTLTSGATSANQTICLNEAITSITYLIGNGATNASISAGNLPLGVSSSFSAVSGLFTISGNALSLGTFNYTVTTIGGCSTASLSGVINVIPSATIVLSSPANTSPQSVCVTTTMIDITYLVGNGATGASISSGVLPSGITTNFSGSTFTISGIPTVSGTFNYQVTTSGGCSSGSISGTIIVEPLPQVNLPQNGFICVDVAGNPLPSSTFELETNLSATSYSFVWFNATGVINGETGNSYLVTTPGNYSVQVTNNSTTCSSIATATVVPSLPPASAIASSTSYFEDDQVVTITVTPAGDYEYQIDNGAFQESNQFSNLSSGTHIITIRDKYSCGSITTSIEIYDYPKFFTPNGDGYNDTWNIPVLANQPKSKIYLFDRYGKLIKEISPAGTGWDGTLNSKQLPSTDYWFKVFYEEMGISKEFSAHFSLKR